MSQHGEAPETRETLAAALAATRRSFDGESERAHVTERRILESIRRTPRKPRVFWVVPLAAAFVVSGAFADEIGQRLSDLTTGWFADGDAAPPAPSSSGSTARSPAPTPEPPVAPAPTASIEPAPAAPAAPVTAPTSVASPPASTSVAPVRPVPSSRAATEAAGELAIYKQAHHAHFVARDYRSALAGWDRYLAVAPRGTFALEARYNRAIALHRLGRRVEALEALRPFADGAYGRYRRDEAQELIEELR